MMGTAVLPGCSLLGVDRDRVPRRKMKSAGAISLAKLSTMSSASKKDKGHRRNCSVKSIMGFCRKGSANTPVDFRQISNSPSPRLQETRLETPWFLTSPDLKAALASDLENTVKHQVGCPVGSKSDLQDLDKELVDYIYAVLALPRQRSKLTFYPKKWQECHQKLSVTVVNGRGLWCGDERHDRRLQCQCHTKVRIALVSSKDGKAAIAEEGDGESTQMAPVWKPTWNSNHHLLIGKVQESSLLVQLLDKSDKLIGDAIVPLEEILVSWYESWVKLHTAPQTGQRITKNDSCGEIKLSIKYLLQQPTKVRAHQSVRDVFQLAAQSFMYHDFMMATRTADQEKKNRALVKVDFSVRSMSSWDGEMTDLSMYLLLQMQHQYDLTDFCMHVRSLAAAVAIFRKIVDERRRKETCRSTSNGKGRKRSASPALKNIDSSTGSASASDLKGIVMCVGKLAAKVLKAYDINGHPDTEEMSSLSKSVKTCSDIALDLISSCRELFPPPLTSLPKSSNPIDCLLRMLCKLYALPTTKSKTDYLKCLQEDLASSILARVKHWHGQHNLTPLESLAQNTTDPDQVLVAMKELAMFMKKSEGVLKREMTHLDALFAKVDISYSEEVCGAIFDVLLPELVVAKQMVSLTVDQSEEIESLADGRQFIKGMLRFAASFSDFNHSARVVADRFVVRSRRNSFLEIDDIFRSVVSTLLPHCYLVWELETKEMISRTLQVEMEWYKLQTVESLCNMDREGFELQSAATLKSHLSAIWITHNVLLQGITARNIIRHDGMLIAVILNCVEFYLGKLADQYPKLAPSSGLSADINAAPLVCLSNWAAAQLIAEDLGNDLVDQFQNIVIDERTAQGVSQKSLYTFGQDALQHFQSGLQKQLETYQAGESEILTKVATNMIDPFISQLSSCSLSENGYEILHPAMSNLKNLFENFEMVMPPESVSRLVAEMFTKLINALQSQVIRTPFLKPGFYRRLLWQLSHEQSKESSLEFVFAMHTSENLQDVSAFKTLQRFLAISGVSTADLVGQFWEREASSTAVPDCITTTVPIKVKTSYQQGTFVTVDIFCHLPTSLHDREAGAGSVFNRLFDLSALPHETSEVYMDQFYVPFLSSRSQDKTYKCESPLPPWQPGTGGLPAKLSLCVSLQGIGAPGACILFRLYERHKRRLTFDSEDYYGRALLPLASFFDKDRCAKEMTFDLVFNLQEVSGGDEIFFAIKHRAEVVRGPALVFFNTTEKFRKQGLQTLHKLTKLKPR